MPRGQLEKPQFGCYYQHRIPKRAHESLGSSQDETYFKVCAELKLKQIKV